MINIYISMSIMIYLINKITILYLFIIDISIIIFLMTIFILDKYLFNNLYNKINNYIN
jgi:hypothetical protein